ncbi:MAG: efflux RND transporter permease subunit, partial [Pseudomonadota bacterium]
DAVAAAVVGADAKVQSGRVLGQGSDFLLDVEGDIGAIDRVSQVILRQTADGSFTRLGDIAEISRGPREPAEAYAYVDGGPAILIAVMVSEGLRIDQWMGWLQEDLEAFRAELPRSIVLEQVFDQSEYTAERLAEVGLNMAIGVALVVAVLLVTLGVRAALIVALVLPVVSLATIASMNVIGLPIHQMSVTGLIVALGLLVDAAIVMTDEVRQRLARGMARIEAVGRSVKRLTAPLLASTVTTALSFVPMILLPGPAGDFVGSIAIAVVLMLVWSFIVAVTLTPAIAGWLLPGAGKGSGLKAGPLGWLFRKSLELSVAHPLKSVALALVLPVMGFMSFPTLQAQFFPGVDRDQFHIEVELAAGTGIARTRDLVDALDVELRGTEGIAQVSWVIGKSAPAFYYNIVGTRENAPGFAQALVTTESAEATAALLTPLQD